MAATDQFALSIQAFIDRGLSDSAQSAQLARIARNARDELIEAGRAAPAYETFVDGAEGVSEEQVRPTGRITYRFGVLGSAAQAALDYLRKNCPADSGRYRQGFFVAVNGRPIMADQFRPQSVPVDAEIIIGNREPYNRKIDVQLVGRRALHYSIPAGLFDRAKNYVNRRFGNTLQAVRLYTVSLPAGFRYIEKRGRDAGTAAQSPVLQITRR